MTSWAEANKSYSWRIVTTWRDGFVEDYVVQRTLKQIAVEEERLNNFNNVTSVVIEEVK